MNKGKELLLTVSTIFAIVILPLVGYSQTYGTSDRQARTVLTRIETRTDTFRREVNLALDRSPLNSTNREDRIADFINDFETATDSLRRNYDSRSDVRSGLDDVLNRALFINRFMARNRLTSRAQTHWTAIRNDLNSLSRIYSVSWNWNRVPDYGPMPGPGNNGGYGRRGFDERITGTYRLNRTLSDDVNQVLDRSDDAYTVAQRDRMRRNLERRLSSPEMMAIEKQGQTMSMASGLSPQVTFDVDGVARTETTNRGRTIRTTASATRDSVEISYVGERANDFYLTLSPTRDGQLRVTRKLYLENRNETVSVSSVYDKIADVAQWSNVNTDSPWNPGNGTTAETFFIPNGTRLTAVLNNLVTSKATQVGDRFTMNITSPTIYRDAVIEGRVASIDNSGRLSGRANMSLEFDTVRMRDGRTYRFAGLIDSVRAANGETVTVNNEGAIRDNNQTTKTVTRAGIGAALGALIGAIAGGGQGAAIGAAVGAGAGAGSVLIQGRDNVELEQGSQFMITATGPTNVGLNR
ncbi:MAG TPA: YMGG-like glycine zipper-containing protein [Pyrinomonadaceae bacterium]|nr:YMGG-like glycine zipper-containing protein [Pyrinomonadaceae bacterium]